MSETLKKESLQTRFEGITRGVRYKNRPRLIINAVRPNITNNRGPQHEIYRPYFKYFSFSSTVLLQNFRLIINL